VLIDSGNKVARTIRRRRVKMKAVQVNRRRAAGMRRIRDYDEEVVGGEDWNDG